MNQMKKTDCGLRARLGEENFMRLCAKFRDGIFSLRTRRFGAVGEFLIELLYGLKPSSSIYHDREKDGKRIEIKFSVAMHKNRTAIRLNNIISECLDANVSRRVISCHEIEDAAFDSNIAQVKPALFDVLYYGLFLYDRIAVFRAESREVEAMPGYSDKQHKGNCGEGQFHLNRDTLAYHFQHHFVRWVGYDDYMEMLSEHQSASPEMLLECAV